jgi:hypothetical protein
MRLAVRINITPSCLSACFFLISGRKANQTVKQFCSFFTCHEINLSGMKTPLWVSRSLVIIVQAGGFSAPHPPKQISEDFDLTLLAV